MKKSVCVCLIWFECQIVFTETCIMIILNFLGKLSFLIIFVRTKYYVHEAEIKESVLYPLLCSRIIHTRCVTLNTSIIMTVWCYQLTIEGEIGAKGRRGRRWYKWMEILENGEIECSTIEKWPSSETPMALFFEG